MQKNPAILLGILLPLLHCNYSQASCGSAFCVINTDWTTQGMKDDVNQVKIEVRTEFIDQSSLRRGSHGIDRSQDSEDTLETKTINRNVLTTIDYSATKNWSFTALLPVVNKFHSHVNDPHGVAQVASWSFSRMGDIKLLTTYRLDNNDTNDNLGFRAGIKLPTGDYQVTNTEGAIAERALQPGTGSTDFIVGAYYSSTGFTHNASFFTEASMQSAVMTNDAFRPGNQYQLSSGYKQPITQRINAILQLNSIVKQRDSGFNAEPALSGLKSIYVTPGLSFSVNKDWQAYSYLQLPVYRYVNGIQLSAEASLIAGVTFKY